MTHVSLLRAAIVENQRSPAVHAAKEIKALISVVVNTKQAGLKGLQQAVVASGCVEDLITLARQGEPVAYEALQILCYRNAVACEQVAGAGVGELSRDPCNHAS
jgi:phosphopantothenate-cysteine ligase